MSSSTLVIQTAFLGDVVLTTGLLSYLAERVGPVDVVTTPAALPLLETHPAVRRAIGYDKRGADRGFGGLVRLAGRLRREAYSRAYLPHRSIRSATLARLAGIPRPVIERAREVLLNLEGGEFTRDGQPRIARSRDGGRRVPPGQMELFVQEDPAVKEIRDRLRRADLDRLTPLEALNLLAELRALLEP